MKERFRKYSQMTVAVMGQMYRRDMDSVTEAKTIVVIQMTWDQ